MSDHAIGTVDLDLPEGAVSLVPTLGALKKISKGASNFMAARQGIILGNAEALLLVIRSGLSGLPDKRMKGLEEELFSYGFARLRDPALRFLRILEHGGRPVPEAEGDEPKGGEGDQGNA